MSAVAAPAPAAPPRGERGTRLSLPLLVGAFLLALGLIVGLALVLVNSSKPAKAKPPCSFGRACPPPKGQRLLHGTVWKSALGFQLEYPARLWSVERKSADELVLSVSSRSGDKWVLTVSGKKTGDYKSFYNDKVGSLKSRFGLVSNTNAGRKLLGPSVGYQPGTGGSFCGNDQTSQGGASQIDAVAMAAAKDGVSVFVSLVGPDCVKTNVDGKSPLKAPELEVADYVLTTLRWPSETS
jgi:hypothetical protein